MINCCSCCCPHWILMRGCSSGWYRVQVQRSCRLHAAIAGTCEHLWWRLNSHKSQLARKLMLVDVEKWADDKKVFSVSDFTRERQRNLKTFLFFLFPWDWEKNCAQPPPIWLTDMHLHHVLSRLKSSAFREYKSQSQTTSSELQKLALRVASSQGMHLAGMRLARLVDKIQQLVNSLTEFSRLNSPRWPETFWMALKKPRMSGDDISLM